MIIGINGRIYAGKDATAQIIQKLTSKEVARDDMGAGYNIINTFEIKKFAGKLKQIAALLTGFPVDKFEDRDFKGSFLPDEWAYLPDINEEIVTDGVGLALKRMTVRTFLQKLGTECVRDNLHVNTWTNALFADYKPIVNCCSSHINSVPVFGGCDCGCNDFEIPNWIITDCRFPNEYDAVKQRGGIVIRVNRGEEVADSSALHESETALDGFSFDYQLDNNGNLQDLEENVRQFLIRFDLL